MRVMDPGTVSARWDKLYRSGRYDNDPPIPFVKRILHNLEEFSLLKGTGLYIGCGNGRNYLPLINSGLHIYGVDISAESLRQLTAKEPAVAEFLVHADFRKFQHQRKFDYIIAIQVFQHGYSADIDRYFANVRSMLMPGGLFFLRVNAASTQIYRPHTIMEQTEFGGITIIYDAGSKQGMPVHFYSREEILNLTRDGFEVVNQLREVVTHRTPPETGFWSQWEGIWRRCIR